MFAHSFVVPLLNRIGKSVVRHLLPVNGVEMKVKWKCVWKVLKPKIIASLIIILVAVVCAGVIILLGNYWISTIDYTKMSPEQQQQMIATSCGSCGFSLSSLIAFIMIIGGCIGIVWLAIELIKSLAEALKPCIIWEEK